MGARRATLVRLVALTLNVTILSLKLSMKIIEEVTLSRKMLDI